MQDVQTLVQFIRFFFLENAPQQNYGYSPDRSSQVQVTPLEDRIETHNKLVLVEGCRPFTLPRSSASHISERIAYAMWDREWCIIEQRTGIPLRYDLIAPKNFEVSIHPYSGVLKIKKSSPSTKDRGGLAPIRKSAHSLLSFDGHLTSPATPTDELDILTIDLWTPPPAHRRDNCVSFGRIPDAYTQPEIANYLTKALGVPCTLARYRPKIRSTITHKQNCVVPSCKELCSDDGELKRHYEIHRMEFDRFMKQEIPSGVSENNKYAGKSA